MERLKKYNIPGRNQPCYCGSGKKFKKCHAEAVASHVAGENHEFAKRLANSLLEQGRNKLDDNGNIVFVD